MCLAVGIGLYFKLRVEPAVWAYAISGSLALGAGLLALRSSAVLGPFMWAMSLVAAGFSIAGARAYSVADPVIGWRYYGPIEGRVVGDGIQIGGVELITRPHADPDNLDDLTITTPC